MGAGAGDEQDGGKWAGGARGGERAGKGDVGFGVGEGDFFLDVGVRLGGILRAADFQRLILADEIQFLRDVGLRPGAGDGVFRGVDGPFVGAAYAGDFEIYRGLFLADFAGREAADALVEAVEGGDHLLFVVVGDVELQAEAQAGSFESALPSAFGGENGVGFAAGDAGSFAMESNGNGDAGLAPSAFEGLVGGGEFAFEGGACTGDFESDSGFVAGDVGGFDVVDGLVEAVQFGVELAVGGFGEMEDDMEGGVATF